MKTFKLAVLFLLSPLVFFAQTLTGLWIGAVQNDSTTIRKDQSFEIVLTQYKNKVYGYSRSTFTVHDSLFYIVKRVKGVIDGDVCEVKDDDIVSYNFKGRLDKGVKMKSTFHFDDQDSVWRMDGDWKTNKTKKYYVVSGKIALAQEKDITKSKIFPHLEELKLANDVAFYNDYKKMTGSAATVDPPTKNNKEELAKTNRSSVPAAAKETKTEVKEKQVVKEDASHAALSSVAVANSIKKDNVASQEKAGPVAGTGQSEQKEDTKTEAVAQARQPDIKNNEKNNGAAAQTRSASISQSDQTANEFKKPVIVEEPKKLAPITEAKSETKTKEITSSRPPVSISSESKRDIASSGAEFVARRKTIAPQVVTFSSDSLELALYDNGEVDGDTVSVLLNGELILAKQGLKASAIKKTIYVPAGKDDSMTLVLYAENLGIYPPNTGLLIVHDGEDTYQIRFSADLQQNAAVIFKRRRN